MPLTVGDANVQAAFNELEQRVDALEKAVGKLPKSGVTQAVAEKIAETKVEEAKAADAKPADSKGDR